MGNAMNRCCVTRGKTVRVYCEKRLLVQFSGPVPAAKLMRKHPKHLIVYSCVKPPSKTNIGKGSESHSRVLIRVVQQGDVLQVGQLYFLVPISDQYTAKLVKSFDPRTPPMSSRSMSIPSSVSSDSSPAHWDPFQQYSSTPQRSGGEEKPRAKDTVGSTPNVSSQQTPSKLTRSNGRRVRDTTMARLVDHPDSLEHPTRFTRSTGRRVILPHDVTTARISSQHEKGGSPYLSRKSPRRHSKPGTGKSCRPRRSGVRPSHHAHKAAGSRPGARSVGPAPLVGADYTRKCLPLLQPQPSTMRTASRDSAPAPSANSRAAQRTRSILSHSGHWTPTLNDISENSISLTTEYEDLIRRSYNQMKMMTATTYGSRR